MSNALALDAQNTCRRGGEGEITISYSDTGQGARLPSHDALCCVTDNSDLFTPRQVTDLGVERPWELNRSTVRQ